jgi:hypothetical protein
MPKTKASATAERRTFAPSATAAFQSEDRSDRGKHAVNCRLRGSGVGRRGRRLPSRGESWLAANSQSFDMEQVALLGS